MRHLKGFKVKSNQKSINILANMDHNTHRDIDHYFVSAAPLCSYLYYLLFPIIFNPNGISTIPPTQITEMCQISLWKHGCYLFYAFHVEYLGSIKEICIIQKPSAMYCNITVNIYLYFSLFCIRDKNDRKSVRNVFHRSFQNIYKTFLFFISHIQKHGY